MHEVLRALVLAFGVAVIGFGLYFWWVTFRLRTGDRDVVPWAIANGAFHVAVGAVIILSGLHPGAVPYAALAVGVILVIRILARRRLRTGEGGLR